MANLGLIDFKIGLYIKVNWHKIGQMPLWRKNINLVIFRPILTLLFFQNPCFLKTNRMVTITKLYDLKFRFWFCPSFCSDLKFRFWFLLRGLTWVVLHVWTQNYLRNVGTCPGRPLELLT